MSSYFYCSYSTSLLLLGFCGAARKWIENRWISFQKDNRQTKTRVCQRRSLTTIDSEQNDGVDAVDNMSRLSVGILDRGDVASFGVDSQPAARVVTHFVPARANKVHHRNGNQGVTCYFLSSS